jgi:P-type conjugative transfer protein TrbJ
MKKIYTLFMIISLGVISIPSYSTMPVIDVAALAQLSDQLVQLEQQTQLIQYELETLKSGQYQWSNAQGLINNLGSVVNQTNGISYSAANIDGQFKKSYPGYQAPQNFSQQYKDNANTSINTMNGILQSVGSSAQDFENENSRLKFLQQQSQSAKGQTEAIQASTQIASETVTQLQLLRQTVIAQTNAQTVYYATQTQNEASAQAELQKVVSAGSTNIPAYGSSGQPLNPPS